MVDWQLSTPVAFLIFNRPETTRLVFSEIAKARPPKLLVVADGPRFDRPDEADRCAAAREIIDGVDWPCEVLKNYSEVNLGCRRRISSGLDWVFQIVEEAVVLEDDCLPHPTFFRFCEELLERYAAEERVMHISGDNFQFGRRRGRASYYFSRYAHNWGWATWRRAWKHFDLLRAWVGAPDKNAFLGHFENAAERRFWRWAWDSAAGGNVWGYQWNFACVARGGLAVLPNVNLVSNIGFGADATHTTSSSRLANMPTSGMMFPLVHPAEIARDVEADESTSQLVFRLPSLPRRLLDRGLGKARRSLRQLGLSRFR